jgi:hypothetical protein
MLSIIDEAAHMLPGEKPQQFVNEVTAFLSRTSEYWHFVVARYIPA